MQIVTRARVAAVASLLTLALAGTAAVAQTGRNVPQAFAAVQAPEAAVEVCHGTSAQGALDCARNRCRRKAGRGACFAVTVCEPAGWAGVMGIKLAEVHFSTTLCGAPSQEALLTALGAYCRGHTGYKQCVISQIWSPDGKLHKVEQSWTPTEPTK